MAKHYSKKRSLKYLLVALTCTASFTFGAFATACSKDTDSEEDTATTSVEDTQLLKNGNFEFFTEPESDAVYLINSPSNWSSSGSSYTKSGIINTSDKAWAQMTDEGLKDALIYNNDLTVGTDEYDKNYIDYNGMNWYDIPYVDTYAAIQDNNGTADESEDEDNETDPYAIIANPGTHYGVHKNDKGELVCTVDGEEVPVYEDENGDYFLDEDFNEPISHILMVHNYTTTHNGTKQYYSSVSVELPQNTAAEITLWVKTSNLTAQKGTPVSQDRGAFIGVSHTVGSTSLGDFKITDINTEKLIGEGKATDEYDGWVQYTVYVNACDFASTTVSLKLGLGDEDEYNVGGYAFFDDVQVTKYIDLEDSSYTDVKAEIDSNKSFIVLSTDESEKVFKADSYERNGGEISDDRFSRAFNYLIDLASESEYQPVTFGSATIGLTVDEDDYASANSYDGKLIGFTGTTDASDASLPKDFTARNTSNDLLAYIKAGSTINLSGYKYNDLLNDALENVTSLPKLQDSTNNNVLVMLSANGAAYKSSFDINVPVTSEGYQIISFWVKTSDLSGNTAATVTIHEKDDDETTAFISLDTTNVKTEIGDNEDIYDGWVQCFFFVSNESDEAKTLTVDVNFGNTVIKDTAATSYRYGWIAVANMQVLEVDEDTFAYTGSASYTDTLTIEKEPEDGKTAEFDEVYGSQSNDIKTGIANPANYTGVNGSSSYIVNNGSISLPFDDKNTNANAGLINKEYFEDYNGAWKTTLLDAFNASSLDALEAWNEIFGTNSVQPLLIVNTLRDKYVITKEATEDTYKTYYVKNEDGTFSKVADDAEFDEETDYYSLSEIINYGFIGETATVASNGYTTVSVRVKVSKGAIAYIYLVDNASQTKDVLTFTAPDYSFYYDAEGNVLDEEFDEEWTKSEHKSHIIYTLRDDGLYEKNGELYANVWNYTKVYTDEAQSYFTYDGKQVHFDDLVDGETYYKDANHATVADHYLAATDGTRIYVSVDGTYYYIVKGVATDAVKPFDTSLARYDYTELSKEYVAIIDGNDADVADKWITVSFVISAGSESKNYRLELWSGQREQEKTEGNTEGGVVIFDYSYFDVSDSTLIDYYSEKIIEAYNDILEAHDLLHKNIASSEENINYYKELVEGYINEGKIPASDLDKYEILKNFEAYYYTYSMYDAANYIPFNADVAEENETGYDYNATEQNETLAYLSITDGEYRMIFADYATIDQSFDVESEEETEEDETGDASDTSVWLLISSIVLVVALLFTILSILVRDMIKKSRRGKATVKNTYDQNKRNRYIRKLHRKAEDEDSEIVEDTVDAEPEVTQGSIETVETETVETSEPAEKVEEPVAEPQPEEQSEQPENSSDENKE